MQMTQVNHRTETRLEAHRREFIANRRTGPLLRVEDLDTYELTLLNHDFMDRCRGRGYDLTAMYVAYVDTLHSWGVMCPHPQGHRLYMGFQASDTPLPASDAPWFNCRLCGAGVFNT